jgi:hypothetical protein
MDGPHTRLAQYIEYAHLSLPEHFQQMLAYSNHFPLAWVVMVGCRSLEVLVLVLLFAPAVT